MISQLILLSFASKMAKSTRTKERKEERAGTDEKSEEMSKEGSRGTPKG
jgi:hypothetical protein